VVQNVPIQKPTLSPLGIGILAGSVSVAVLAGIGIFAGIMLYQGVTHGALWFVPSDILNDSGVTVNPLYKEHKKKTNPLANRDIGPKPVAE